VFGKSLRDRMAEKWFGVRMAEEALKVSDLADLMQINRDVVRAHNKTHLENYEEGDMGNIHVGDVVNNTNGEPKAGSAGIGKGLLTTMLVSALASGGGLAYLIPMLLDRPVAEAGSGYTLGLGKPDTKQEKKSEVPKRKGQDQER